MRIQHLIDGRPVDSRSTFDTINPATQEVLAVVADGGADEVNAAHLDHTQPAALCPVFRRKVLEIDHAVREALQLLIAGIRRPIVE